ncbi:hypothetical protein GW17_00035538 [Ensete ventricosum]|nr:hypothetical protein GW17_00035538 [Ensete ventricosum]RZR84177.1 hypothetical protein BHM03_00010943 [Ensete ventricosum]
MAVVWLWGCRDASKRTHRGRATPWVSPALRSFLYYAGGGGGRRGPRLWPARAMIIIFGAGEKAEEAEGEGSGCNVKQGKGNYCLMRQWWCMRKMASCIRTPQQRSEEVDDSGSRGSRRRRRVVVDKR